MLGGEQEGALGAAGEADDDRLLGAGRVEDVERVAGELRLGICLDVGRPVALAVAARVEDDHAVVAGEVGDLHLPHPRVHQRPGRAEQDRRLAAAVDLVEDAHAVALDVTLIVRIQRSGLLVRICLLVCDLLGDGHLLSCSAICRRCTVSGDWSDDQLTSIVYCDPMSTADPDVRATPAPSGDLRVAQGQSTRALLLAAAGDLLREEGYAATSTRAVAERAGARLSLVHYHFGSKRSLLLAVLEDLTERLLHRQQAMFSDGRSFAEQWRSACDYLREDVDSGYVRILWELWAAGLADPELAERWRATQRGWRELIEARLERLQTERGAELPMPRAPSPR